MFLRSVLYLLVLQIFAATAICQEVRSPLPSAVDLAEADKATRAVFADEITAAKNMPEKAELARKLLEVGAKEQQNLAGRYSLLSLARELSLAGGDFTTAFAAIDQLAKTFVVDALAAKAQLVNSEAGQRAQFDRASYPGQLTELLEAAMAADRLPLARQFNRALLHAGNRISDPDLVRIATARINKFNDAEQVFAVAKLSFPILAKSPDDPRANYEVGRYKALIKGDWDGGLPHLAKGSDKALKTLAEKDMAGGLFVEAQVVLADGWSELAEKSSGLPKRRMQQRAVYWYSEAGANATGFTKAKVDKRLASLRVALGIAELNRINLLTLIDLQKDVVAGNFKWQNGQLVTAGATGGRIQIPYQVPVEYDLRATFTRAQGSGVVLFLAARGSQFLWGHGAWGNTHSAFDIVRNATDGLNPTTVRGPMPFNQKTEITVQVRKNGLTVLYDGKKLVDYKTDYRDMRLWGPVALPRTDVVGIGCDTNTKVIFHSVDLKVISGTGKPLR